MQWQMMTSYLRFLKTVAAIRTQTFLKVTVHLIIWWALVRVSIVSETTVGKNMNFITFYTLFLSRKHHLKIILDQLRCVKELSKQ